MTDVGGARHGLLGEAGLGPEPRVLQAGVVVKPMALSCIATGNDAVVGFTNEAGVFAFGAVSALPSNDSLARQRLHVQAFEVEGVAARSTALDEISRLEGQLLAENAEALLLELADHVVDGGVEGPDLGQGGSWDNSGGVTGGNRRRRLVL